jgi:insulysin
MKEDEKLLLDYEKLDDKYSSHFHPRDRNIENKLPNLKDNHSNLELFLYIIIVTFLVFVLLFIFYFVHFGEYKVEVLLEDKDIFKPVIDMRKYKLIKLQNDLQVFLISDKNTTKCSASLTVGVGSFYDGKIPGLAHFTEHMIFLGSKSYPRPSTFEDHLRNFLGYTNAYTEEERTTFFFDVEWQGFTKALEMFSRMLAEPLFDKEYMNKEIEAVNSENEKNFNKDPWRENQIIKSLANPLHPYSNFMTGNRETLTSPGIETLYTAVTALYDKYYMPDNMKLVVLSNQNLEQLQATVSYFFSDVRREKVEENLRKMTEKEEEEYNLSSGIIPTPNSPYYNPYLFTYPAFKKAGKILWYQKVAGGQHVDIIFNLKEISSCYKTKPLSYLTYLLKFSGEGSLINYLRKNKLSSKLEVGVVASYKTFSQYAISVYLTEEGLQNIKTVIILVFNYLNLIRSSKLKEETFEELRNITSVSFRFLEKSEKYGEYLATIASSMFSIPENEYFNLLQADYIHTDYNETLTKSYLNEMIAEKSFIIVGSVNYTDSMDGLLSGGRSQREKWYLTNYTVSSIPYDFLRVLNSTIAGETFKLREQNNFITNERNVVSCFGVGIITSYKNVTLHELCDLEKVDLTPDFAINSTNLQAWYKVSSFNFS